MPSTPFEDLAGQRLERRGVTGEVEQLVDREPLADGDRHELLGEDVERVARQRRLLDRAVVHALDHDRGLEEVAAVLREDDALAGLADLVSRAADPLEPAGDRGGALDLDHEVHGAHVDAELEAARGHQGGEAAGFQLLLDLEPLLAGDAAVVGADELLAGELVEPLGEALREAAAVREHDRAAVLADELEDPGVDRGPDARALLAADDRAAGLLVLRQHLAEPGHVLDGDDDLDLERLARAGVDDRDLAPLPHPAEEPGDRLERPLGRAQADALERLRRRVVRCGGRAQALEALEAQRQVRAALRAGDRVHLVDDDLLDATEDLAGLAREQEVQALRGRDEDVGRVADEVASLVRGRVAGPAGDRDPGRLEPEALRFERDAREWRAEVALDVVGQGLERGDVERADRSLDATLLRRARLVDQPVEAPQERGERLARPRGRMDQRVPALADRRPARRLGRRRRLERRLEPGPHRGPERREGIVDVRDHGTASIGTRRHFVQMFGLHRVSRSRGLSWTTSRSVERDRLVGTHWQAWTPTRRYSWPIVMPTRRRKAQRARRKSAA